MNRASNLAFDLTEQGLIPDIILRRGIRHLVRQRLREIHSNDSEHMSQDQAAFVAEMNKSPIALVPELANEQHYEVPADFYRYALGKHLKYSSAYWTEGTKNLDEAEANGLLKTVEHARLENGQNILELGCGWGSLTLWMAQHMPGSQITAVSNSQSQREHIEILAGLRGLDNIKVITCDMNSLELEHNQFDRVVSVEMFEHMRNWHELYRRIANWLRPGGIFFKHIFVHRQVPYAFIDNGPSDWMSRYFFSGGMMPCDDLPLMFQQKLNFIQRWRWDGTHYEKTANAWLDNMDKHEDVIRSVFEITYGKENVQTWWVRWRLFFMACAELFGYNNGQEWWVSHYLFEKPLA